MKKLMTICLAVMFLMGSVALADTPYWDTNWGYRQQVAITNNVETTLYDYSMKIGLNTAELISQGKMQSYCGDIRVIENGVEISYGITDPNSASTEIYFIANDLIVGNNNDIYIYYGNSDADDGFVENWKDAFYIWYDDFDTDRGWDNCPGNTKAGTVTVDTVNSWLYAAWGQYNNYRICPTDGSNFPMNGRVGFKAETKIMAENDNLCQIVVILADSNSVPKIAIPDFRVGHNDYYMLWSSRVSKTLSDNVWYEATAVYNRLTGDWYGDFAGDPNVSGTRTPQEDDDFSIIMLDICNNINMYLDYLYLRYFIEPEPSHSLGGEEGHIKWKRIADLPGDQHIACAAVINEQVYIVGGQNPSGPPNYNKMRIYNPWTNSWSDGPDMSTRRYLPGAGVVENCTTGEKELYVVGGYSGYAGLSTVEKYTPSTGTWQTLAPVTGDRGHGIMTAVVNNNLYALGGFYNNDVYFSTNEMYDDCNDVWVPKTPITKDASELPMQMGLPAVYGDNIYIFGGNTSGSALTYTLIYDSISDSWSEGTEIPRHRHGGRAVAFDNFIYLMGGANDCSKMIDVYDPTTDSWSVTADFPGTNCGPIIAQSSGLVYALGDSYSLPGALECWVGASWNVECGDPDIPYPVGDLNYDCAVNLIDLSMLANNWLKCHIALCD